VILNDTTEIEKNSRRRNSLLLQDEGEEIIRISEDEKETRKGFPFFRRKKQDRTVEDEAVSSSEPDMKVPLNNRYKYEATADEINQEVSNEPDQQS
jgi:hypothetical protein